MTIKNYLAIAIATVALTAILTSTGFAQWHPEIDKVKGRRPNTQSIQSPRDVASGQATGKRKAARGTQGKLGNFEIQDLKSPRDPQTGQATGITSPRDTASGLATGRRQHKPFRQALVTNEVIKEARTKQLQPGNSGGTITNQRSRRPNRRK